MDNPCKTATYGTMPLDKFVALCAPKGWEKFFQMKKVATEIETLAGDLLKSAKNKLIEPPMPLMFKAMELVLPDEIRVVILGQDPTPQVGKATGLAFSVPDPLSVGTVLNVLLEVALEGFPVNIWNGDLTSWTKQGVLLLNTAFTVRQGKAGSHLKNWATFSELLVKYISDTAAPSVWLLWGKRAHEYKKFIHKKHYIILGGHPSTLGGVRSSNSFFGRNYFNCANDFFKTNARPPIDWALAGENALAKCPPQPKQVEPEKPAEPKPPPQPENQPVSEKEGDGRIIGVF